MKDLLGLNRRTPWVAALSIAAVLAAANVQAQAPGAQFEHWTESAQGRAPKASCDHLRAAERS
jgi:hypothetical protein